MIFITKISLVVSACVMTAGKCHSVSLSGASPESDCNAGSIIQKRIPVFLKPQLPQAATAAATGS